MRSRWVVAVAVLVSAFGCRRNAHVATTAENYACPDTIVANNDITGDALLWADSVMGCMTLEQRVGQLLVPAVYARDDEYSLSALQGYAADCHIGGVVLLKGSMRGVRAIAESLGKSSVAPPFMAIDAEWGLGMRLEGTPVFPKNGFIDHRAGQDVMYEYGREIARECRLAGINMVLGPVADVSDAGGGMGSRSFGANAERVADLAVAYARGLEDGNVISVAKHFPGHGSARGDSHKGKALVCIDTLELQEKDLLPFKAYVNAGLSGIMAGHLAVPSVDSSLVPASFSEVLLTGVLRNKLAFRGLVLTDALNMAGAEGHSAADAILAGADMVLAPADTRKEYARIMEEIANGNLPVTKINDRCRRILFYKYLITRPLPEVTLLPSDLASPETDSLRRELQFR